MPTRRVAACLLLRQAWSTDQPHRGRHPSSDAAGIAGPALAPERSQCCLRALPRRRTAAQRLESTTAGLYRGSRRRATFRQVGSGGVASPSGAFVGRSVELEELRVALTEALTPVRDVSRFASQAGTQARLTVLLYRPQGGGLSPITLLSTTPCDRRGRSASLHILPADYLRQLAGSVCPPIGCRLSGSGRGRRDRADSRLVDDPTGLWPGRRLRRAVSAVRGHWCQGAVELGPGADAELAEYLVQVVVDGAFADVQAGGDLGVGQSLAGQAGDAGFLRGELIQGCVAAAVRGGDRKSVV